MYPQRCPQPATPSFLNQTDSSRRKLSTKGFITLISSPFSRMGKSMEYPVASTTSSTSSTLLPSSNSISRGPVNWAICGFTRTVPAAILLGNSSLIVRCALKDNRYRPISVSSYPKAPWFGLSRYSSWSNRRFSCHFTNVSATQRGKF